MTGNSRTLVVGGTGFFGGLLVDDLLRHTRLEVTTLSRGPKALRRHSEVARVAHVTADLHDREALRRAAIGNGLIVHAAGPFEDLPLTPLEVAIELGIDYVDISENRGFNHAVEQRANDIVAAGIRVMSGVSVVPGLSALMATTLATDLDRMIGIRTFAAPDTKRHRGKATFHAMLHQAGRDFAILDQGDERVVMGWSEPEWVEFPPPTGRVLTYLVGGMADQDALPSLFAVETVEFRAGCEHPLLNRLVSLAARTRHRVPFPLERVGPLVRGVSWLAGRWGRRGGAAMFEVSGIKGGTATIRRAAISSDSEGEDIPVAIAGIAAEAWAKDELGGPGIVNAATWIDAERLRAGLEKRGLHVLEQHSGGAVWTDLPVTI